jgi:hypothetical protein
MYLSLSLLIYSYRRNMYLPLSLLSYSDMWNMYPPLSLLSCSNTVCEICTCFWVCWATPICDICTCSWVCWATPICDICTVPVPESAELLLYVRYCMYLFLSLLIYSYIGEICTCPWVCWATPICEICTCSWVCWATPICEICTCSWVCWATPTSAGTVGRLPGAGVSVTSVKKEFWLPATENLITSYFIKSCYPIYTLFLKWKMKLCGSASAKGTLRRRIRIFILYRSGTNLLQKEIFGQNYEYMLSLYMNWKFNK